MSSSVAIADLRPTTAGPRLGTLLPDPGVEPTVSVERAAKILGVSRGLAYQAVHGGQLPALRIGRRLRVPTAPLLRLIGSDLPSQQRRPVGGSLTAERPQGKTTASDDPLPPGYQGLPAGWPPPRQGLRQ